MEGSRNVKGTNGNKKRGAVKRMSNNKKQYASIYGATRPIRPDQYLVELIIKRRADKKGITLPQRFWSIKNVQFAYWTQIFGSELRHSKSLFKKYDPECIIDAFNSYDCQYVLSSTNKQLEKITKEFQRRKDLIEQTKQEVNIFTNDINSVPNKKSGTKTRLSKLKDE